MSALPFTMSTEAAAWIEEKLRMGERVPQVASLVPALYYAFSESLSEKDGRITERYSGGFFDIGWYRREVVGSPKFAEVELCGVKLFATTDALERLSGKQLVVETVEIGVPRPSDKTKSILRMAGAVVAANRPRD